MARAVEHFLSTSPRWGVFWDYGSLFQHERTAKQNKLFKQGLGWLGSFYAHEHTTVFRLTSFPAGYPDGYNLPSDANVAAYPNRGCAAAARPAPPRCPAHDAVPSQASPPFLHMLLATPPHAPSLCAL